MGYHAWFPYYAGYSEKFVLSAIDFLNLNSDSHVCDPWNGSGTTCQILGQKKIPVLGFDINPAINVFAIAKSAKIIDFEDPIRDCLSKLPNKFPLSESPIDDPLTEFYNENHTHVIRKIFEFINNYTFPFIDIKNFEAILYKNKKYLNPCKAFLMAGLFSVSRKYSGLKTSKNPTWIKRVSANYNFDYVEFIDLYRLTIDEMFLDLKNIKSNKFFNYVLTNDSKNLPIEDDSIDAVITSPPYLTRIDYAVTALPELLALTSRSEARKIRESSMGSTVILNLSDKNEYDLGSTAKGVLTKIENHSSKSAKAYYLKNIKQYFVDAYLSLEEMKRYLRPGGKALVVVQSSYFKEHKINLADIYQEMGRILGLSASVVRSEVVRTHMAHINTKSQKYVKNKIYNEDMVLFEK